MVNLIIFFINKYNLFIGDKNNSNQKKITDLNANNTDDLENENNENEKKEIDDKINVNLFLNFLTKKFVEF